VLASFRAVRPRVEPDPLNAKALRQRALVCCKGTLAALCLHTRSSDKLSPEDAVYASPGRGTSVADHEAARLRVHEGGVYQSLPPLELVRRAEWLSSSSFSALSGTRKHSRNNLVLMVN
jgi:hypothetical protein